MSTLIEPVFSIFFDLDQHHRNLALSYDLALSGNRTLIPIIMTKAALISIIVMVSLALVPPLRRIPRAEYGSLKFMIGSQV